MLVMMHGAEKSSDSPRNLTVVEDFCNRLAVLPYEERAASHYGSIRTVLKARGWPIGATICASPLMPAARA